MNIRFTFNNDATDGNVEALSETKKTFTQGNKQSGMFKVRYLWEIVFWPKRPYWCFVWKTFLDDRPKPHVCKFHMMILMKFTEAVDFKIWISGFLSWNPQILMKSADFNTIHSRLSDFNRETYIFVISKHCFYFHCFDELTDLFDLNVIQESYNITCPPSLRSSFTWIPCIFFQLNWV